MKRFKNILFVADTDLQCRDTFSRAVMLAENNQSSLTLVAIIDEFPGEPHQKIHGISIAELNAPLRSIKLEQLENLVISTQKTLQVKTQISIKLLSGRDFLTIIQEVLNNKIDLVIKTVDERKFMDRFLGSSDMHLLRKCPCPVWLMKSTVQGNFKKILAAVDFDPFTPKPEDDSLNAQIIQMSLSLALSEFSEWHIVHVWHAYGESSLRFGLVQQSEADVDSYVEEIRLHHHDFLDELVSKFINEGGEEVVNYIKPKVHLIKGFAENKIPELIEEKQIDLIMMGTVGRTGLPGFLMGNTSETILNRIDCSVLAVKPKGFISPVIA
ncbi:MAG: universal stress protein [Gammaproteobacteria bacterium]|nr:universal stress protein [Gammaproteobacteria bacterium]